MTFSSITPHANEVVTDFDSRTRLLSRDIFYQHLEPLVSEGKLVISSLALIVIDVDGLDFILRTFGPGQRDAIVEQVGCRIGQVIEVDYAAYHITQDRFAVVFRELSLEQVIHTAEQLSKALTAPFTIASVSLNLKAYIGLSLYPDNGSSVSELVRTGVFACNKARSTQGRYMLYDVQQDERDRERFYLLKDLEQALNNDSQIEVAYQPQINLADGTIHGVEALCRWRHPKLGIIPPDHFLPFVEQTPLMMPLTEKMLSRSIQDLAEWEKLGFNGNLAVNLSTALFEIDDMQDRLTSILDGTQINSRRIQFEITETSMMGSLKRAIEVLSDFKRAGYGVAMDDFGTGHSSLAYIADLPIDTIKIDMRFVQNMDKPWGRAIVSAAATLANNLSLRTCAEGIETKAQLDACRKLGVSFGQGYLIGRPMFKSGIESWLQGYRTS